VIHCRLSSFLPHRDIFFYPLAYYAAVDKFGSPAWSEDELLGADERYRELADQTDAQVLQATFAAAPGAPTGGCRRLNPRADGTFPELRLSDGGSLYFRPTEGANVQLTMKRFADVPTVSSPAASAPTALSILPDRSKRPWRVATISVAPVVVCRG